MPFRLRLPSWVPPRGWPGKWRQPIPGPGTDEPAYPTPLPHPGEPGSGLDPQPGEEIGTPPQPNGNGNGEHDNGGDEGGGDSGGEGGGGDGGDDDQGGPSSIGNGGSGSEEGWSVGGTPGTNGDVDKTREWIERWEGRRAQTYVDSTGNPTIGVGFNLNRPDARQKIETLGLDYDAVRRGEVELNDEQIDTLLTTDVNTAVNDARATVSNFDALPPDKQRVLVDMAFNLGAAGLAGFRNMIDAVENEDWQRAADEMADSRWSSQVGQRAAAAMEVMAAPPEPSPAQEPEY